jgi:Holliday junction resolvase
VKESTLQRKAIAYLRASGAYVFKVVGSVMQQKGTPDLLVCYRGRMLGIELKVPGNTPTKLQEVELEKIRQAGGVGAVIEDMESLERLINRM